MQDNNIDELNELANRVRSVFITFSRENKNVYEKIMEWGKKIQNRKSNPNYFYTGGIKK